jgi:hemolysin activation/secretion protein
MNRSTVKCLGLLTTALATNALFAAGPPAAASAGIQERQVARQFNLQNLSPDSDIPLLEVDIPREVLNIPEGISVYVENIAVKKNFPLFDKEISAVSSKYENRELNGTDLTDLCVAIQQIYAKAGYITAWVYPPIQRIDNNTLEISVVEGTLDRIQIRGNTSYKTRFIERYFENLKGEPINYNQLMKALLLVNENSDLSVQGLLVKGREFGGADLSLNVQDSRPLQLSVGYNNWGSTITSYNQLSSVFTMGNLATSGDNLSMMTSCGVPFVFYYLNPTYSIPLTGSGANLNLSYAYSFSNTQGDWKEYDMASWTEIASITYNQPLARTRRFQAGINMGFNFAQYKNLEQGDTTSYDRLRIVTLGGTLDYTDSLKGRNVLSPSLNIGIPDIMGGSSVVDDLCSRIGSGGRYFILTLNGQRVQPLLTDCMFVITATAQGTFNKIPLSVQYFLGGMGTVRGYFSAVAVGDCGYCGNFEFYLPPPFIKKKTFKPMKRTWGEIMQLLAFVDHGGIYTVDDVDGEIPSAYLTAVGAGVRFYGPHNFSLSFDAGFPVMNQYKDYNSVFYVRLNMDFL